MLRLWGRTNSLNVMKVIWTLEELDLKYERRDAGMEFGIVNTPEYKAMNPNSRVPTLEDEEFSLFESNTIVRYLCAKYDFGGMYPENLRQRANVERWMDWSTAQLHPVITPIFWNIVRSPVGQRNQKVIDENIKLAIKTFDALEWGLAKGPYVGGERFSMGDIVTGVWVHRWLALPIERPEMPLVQGYYQRLLARPAYRMHVALPLS